MILFKLGPELTKARQHPFLWRKPFISADIASLLHNVGGSASRTDETAFCWDFSVNSPSLNTLSMIDELQSEQA